jgi:hypothetical protein
MRYPSLSPRGIIANTRIHLHPEMPADVNKIINQINVVTWQNLKPDP